MKRTPLRTGGSSCLCVTGIQILWNRNVWSIVKHFKHSGNKSLQGGCHQYGTQGMPEGFSKAPEPSGSSCGCSGILLFRLLLFLLSFWSSWSINVVVQAITLLDACVNNCGRYFLLEVYSSIQQVSYFDKMLTQIASREFETEFRKLLGKSHPKVAEKLKAMLKRWKWNPIVGSDASETHWWNWIGGRRVSLVRTPSTASSHPFTQISSE